ncbi:MAG: Uma2 family endonuclease, partial [Chloroflexota bacterium]|nr:Uma2 family endonuclease [Chloroflexota bacterium]
MVIRTPEDIDFSTFPESDGQPMAETTANVIQMVDLLGELKALLSLQGRADTTTVGGNQFVYYNPANGRDNISPDVYVVFGVAVLMPAKWRTWIDGPFPHVVFEITSPSTEARDLSEGPRGKRRLYAELGAQEYYIYDPQQEMDPPFLGYALRGGRMERLPYTPHGGVESPLLRAELRPMTIPQMEWRATGVWLRVIDPRTGEPIPIAEEDRDELQAAREQVTMEERARLA